MGMSPYVARLREAIGHDLLLLPSVAVLPVRHDGAVLLVRRVGAVRRSSRTGRPVRTTAQRGRRDAGRRQVGLVVWTWVLEDGVAVGQGAARRPPDRADTL